LRALLIAEKPSLMRTIQNVYEKHKSKLNYTCDFLAQAGHLMTLKLPNELVEDYGYFSWEHLPFNPEDNGGWKYKLIAGSGPSSTASKRYNTIKKTLKDTKYDFIIHAGDPDQEGQLLVDIVLKELKVKIPIKRYWSNDTTEGKVLDALKNLRDYNEPMQQNLLKAAYGRQHSDYRFGMNLSEAASLKLRTRAAVGRVKTPILAIVCQREDEIKNFVPKTEYGVKAIYGKEFSGQLYVPTDDDGNEKEEESGLKYFANKEDALSLISHLNKIAVVDIYKKERIGTTAPKLFSLATCQIASGKLGYTPNETLEIIQSLYEQGYVSYPRTDCCYISSKEDLGLMLKSAMSISEFVPFVKTISKDDIEKVKGTKKYANDKELESHGHSALTPTAKKPDYNSLSKKQQDIYRLICRQFIAIFLKPLIQEKVTLITDVDGHKFKSSGKTLVSEGFSKIFDTNFTDTVIPSYKKGDVIDVEEYDLSEKTSKCPTHLSETDIIQICEKPHKYLLDDKYKSLGKNLKIGTPATRASIIDGLITRDKYLCKKKINKKEILVPTESGRLLYENLKFCKICRVDLTGEWEERLEKVRRGELDFDIFEQSMIKDTSELVNDIKKADITPIGSSKKSFDTICVCPQCGGNILSGPKGYFCSNWKEKSCKMGGFKNICDSKLSDDEFIKLISGEIINKTIKKGSSSWDQKIKYNFEQNKYDFMSSEHTIKKSEYKCPSCKNELEENGKKISCKCGFTFWTTVCGKDLPKTQINKFFKCGETDIIKNLKSKAGKSFNAKIVLKDDKKGTEFKFV